MAIRPGTAASLSPDEASAQSRSKPARLGNMHAFTAAALDLLLDVLAGDAATSA